MLRGKCLNVKECHSHTVTSGRISYIKMPYPHGASKQSSQMLLLLRQTMCFAFLGQIMAVCLELISVWAFSSCIRTYDTCSAPVYTSPCSAKKQKAASHMSFSTIK